MASLNLQFTTTGNYTGNITAIQMVEYNYDKHGIQLYDDLSYDLNFQVFDIENLEQRASTYSKTITIPGTAVNNKIFSNLYDIDVDVITSNETLQLTTDVFFGKKINCELLYDSIPVKEGFFELKKVSYNEGRRQIEYEGEFYSKSKSFSENVGDKKLTGNEDVGEDLDFSMYDHDLSMDNFLGSHSGPYYTGSTGYYYPIIDFTNIESGNYANIEEFRPALYVKEVIDKIFTKAGYSYESTFFDSELFKSLIIPWTGQVKIDDDEIELRNWRVGMTTGTTNTDYTGDGPVIWGNASPWGYEYRDFWTQGPTELWNFKKIPFNVDSPDPFYNSVNDDFNVTDYKWYVPHKGKYKLSCTTTQHIYGIRWEGNTGHAGIYYHGGDKNIEIMYRLTLSLPGGKSRTLNSITQKKQISQVNGDTWIPYWTHTLTWSGVLNPGEMIYYEVLIKDTNEWYDTGGVQADVRLWININADDSVFSLTSEPGFQLYEGELVEMRKALPQDQLQIDFFKDIVNMFNLVVDEVPDTDNTLLIETRNDYYNSGVTLDWTNKEDISQAEEIERIPTLINRDFKLSYLSDKDDYNTQYEDDNRGLVYGNHKVKNPYLSNTTYEVKVNMSPTPLGNLGGTNWGVSKVFDTNDRGEIKETEFQTRILYRKNLSGQTEIPWVGLQPFYILHDNTGSTSFGTYWYLVDKNYQPYAGHLDMPYQSEYGDVATLDLNFGLCNDYYFSGLPDNMTPNNIYNVYWRDYIAELMDLNSKKVTKWIKLEVDDIYNLSFSSKIWIDGVLYVLDKIIDWNPGQITKVELLKLSKYDLDITDPPAYRTNTILKKTLIREKKAVVIEVLPREEIIDPNFYTGPTGNVGGGSINDWNTYTRTAQEAQQMNMMAGGSYGIIVGRNNQVEDGGGVILQGNDNIVKSGSSNITIFGSNVTIEEGVSNVTVLANENTGTTISDSNLVYLPSGYTISNHSTTEEVDTKITEAELSGATYTDSKVEESSGNTLKVVDENYYNTGITYSKTEVDNLLTGTTSGTSGIDGLSGATGADGTSGTSGSSGVDGTSGTSGSSGEGFSGATTDSDLYYSNDILYTPALEITNTGTTMFRMNDVYDNSQYNVYVSGGTITLSQV